jgi:hypothetical protein
MRSNHANNSAGEPTKDGRISRAAVSAIAVAQAVSAIAAVQVVSLIVAVVNLAAEIVPQQRTVAVEVAWVVARVAAAALFKALAVAVAQHEPPAHAAARAGEALVVAGVVRGAAVAVVVVAVAVVGGAGNNSTR